MNVNYKDISTGDAARILKLDITTVSGWCRADKINFCNLSNGTQNGRYMIPEDEVYHIKELIKIHGKAHWQKFYDKNWNKKEEKKPVNVITSDEAMFLEEYNATHKEEVKPVKLSSKVDIDSIAITIGYIQDIKERLKDLEAEKAQLLNEYTQLKQEVIGAIELNSEGE